MTTKKEYILGTDNDELMRLAVQHRIWADTAVTSWRRAGIGPGSKVLDMGSGPGYASIDLAQLVTEKGQVLGVDEAANFVEFLNQKARAQDLHQLRAQVADAQDLTASVDGGFDAIYTRWVLCWLDKPEKALDGMRKLLSHKGRLVIHDYFNWTAMKIAPRSRAVENMVQAALRSFEERNGDVDVVGKLPALLRKAGFEITHFEIHQRVARGGGLDSTAAWPLMWWRSYGPKLVKSGHLSAADGEEAMRQMDLLEKDPDMFFFCPPLFEIIATIR